MHSLQYKSPHFTPSSNPATAPHYLQAWVQAPWLGLQCPWLSDFELISKYHLLLLPTIHFIFHTATKPNDYFENYTLFCLRIYNFLCLKCPSPIFLPWSCSSFQTQPHYLFQINKYWRWAHDVTGSGLGSGDRGDDYNSSLKVHHPGGRKSWKQTNGLFGDQMRWED